MNRSKVEKSAVHIVKRAGGKYEGIGFVLIIAGLFLSIAKMPFGGWAMFIGFVVFLIGRFK